MNEKEELIKKELFDEGKIIAEFFWELVKTSKNSRNMFGQLIIKV